MPRPTPPPVKPVTRSGPPAALIGAVVALVVAIIAVAVWAATRGGSLDSAGSANALEEGGGIVAGADLDADVPHLRIYEDPQCPWCGVLENSIGPALAEKIEAGEVSVTYQIMSFLDGSLRNDSSVRATNAALCADDAGIFKPFHASIYANQPAQEGAGFTDEQFLAWAQAAGLQGGELDTFTQCVADVEHQDYVADMQERANKDGVTGTPRLFVNGTQIADTDMQRLMQDPSALDEVIGSH